MRAKQKPGAFFADILTWITADCASHPKTKKRNKNRDVEKP